MIVREKQELIDLVGLLKKEKKILLTSGCFDLLHYAHIKHLNNLKVLAADKLQVDSDDICLLVSLNTDSSILKYKHALPAVEEMQRAVTLDELLVTDIIFLMQESSPLSLLKELKPHAYGKGPDWPLELLPEAERKAISDFDITYICDEVNGPTRSSEIKDRIYETKHGKV